MPRSRMSEDTYRRLVAFVEASDLPRKPQKVAGLYRAYLKQHPLTLVDDTILLDGIAIDTSELETGHWL